MIVATAGHIDHGKSTLVKALTGVDTDRLPEERARGISIDLGFAYLSLASTPTIGFVDVPGHERFVRNMLAGVCGIDYVMLVVAADDGVMPQTVEHLSIVNLLGVQAGVAVLTKVDRVSTERVAEVRQQVHACLQDTNFSGIEIVECSAPTQTGIPELRNRLAQAARELHPKKLEGQSFRFAIDRSFSIVGSGTVVTGTVFAHQVRVGDRLTVSPPGNNVRVRGIHKNSIAATEAKAGERCALNIVGVSTAECGRGNWLVAPTLHAPTTRLDVRLTVLSTEVHWLAHWTQVHLHVGTTEVVAHVSIRRAGALAPGETGRAQFVLSHPIACVSGDRFIVRDQSAQRTIGGGIVLDPFAPRRVRHRLLRDNELDALSLTEPAAALAAMLACHGQTGFDVDQFGRGMNIDQAELSAMLAQLNARVIAKEPTYVLLNDAYTKLTEQILTVVRQHHRLQPQAAGINLKELRQRSAQQMKASVFLSFLKNLTAEKKIVILGAVVALTAHQSTANSSDQLMWQKIQPALMTAGFKALTVEALAQSAGLKTLVLNELLHRKAKEGELYRVPSNRFYTRATFIEFSKLAKQLALANSEQTFIAAQFRDIVGVNRTLAIEILEVLDRLGITQRVGDARKLFKSIESVFGPQ